MRNKKLINRRNDITQVWQFCSPKISPCKRKEKKGKKNYNTGYSYLVTHPSTNSFEQGLNSTLSAFFFNFQRREKIAKREKNLWHCMARKVENKKKIEEYENENYYLLWLSDNSGTPLIIASVSRTKITRSHADR